MKHKLMLSLILSVGTAMIAASQSHAQFTLPVFQCTLTNKLDVYHWPGTPQENYTPTTGEIFFICESDNASTGDRVKAVWIADHTNNGFKPNTIISSQTHRVVKPQTGDQTSEANLSLKKPAKTWPTGTYHVQLYVNNIEDKSYSFTVR